MNTSQAPDPVVGWKTVMVTDDFLRSIGIFAGSSIMMHTSCREGRMTHNTARRGHDGRWYVRKGKQGAVVRFLTECQITYVDGEPTLYQFKTDWLQLMSEFDAKIAERKAERLTLDQQAASAPRKSS